MCTELNPIRWDSLHLFNTVEVTLDIWSAGDNMCRTARYSALMNALMRGDVKYTTISGIILDNTCLVWQCSDDLLIERESFLTWAIPIEESHRVKLQQIQEHTHA